ncbi:uncharacterized protein HMPREF1541_08122 [Cyphellophora europaea CBS 101466]|uniref:Uncharacterized protein n=1 Tax=Cyphellophora europaea (strain CBS 101466) TaxID=1220924 RepID=W2RKW2_CYPE1|nr:uncharacterized protein HMPREF1541_08122 [Cyphellophora europaea CBS 101466]ETN37132.1 hypothetical protein HMPREF1541_08122 [Cyphellophora europaea CBS 101466]
MSPVSSFVLPTDLTPLFTVQQVVCAYPISDAWAATPRYLYYALLLATLVVRTRSWLVQVFLGAAATYAGVASIQAFILISDPSYIADGQQVSIPFVDSAAVTGNATYEALPNLWTDTSSVEISPAIMELDIDAILAVVITGYLSMLPMHCWSHTVRAYRALHLLVGLWNLLMLGGSICALVLWPSLDWNTFPFQYRFCYPDYPDGTNTNNDGWNDNTFRGSWNSTVWYTFQNLSANLQLSDNCLYPCFSTSQILRQQSSATASLNTNKNPRTSNNLSDAQYRRFDELTYFMFGAIALSTIIALVLLALNVTGLRRITRVPVHRPQLLWKVRKELWHAISQDIRAAFTMTRSTMTSPQRKYRLFQGTSRKRVQEKALSGLRLFTDLIALLCLLLATVFVPLTNIAFIVWIEWFIHRDLISKETPKQVGQWSSLAAVALVLVSALVLRAKYYIAPKTEIEADMETCRKNLAHLETLWEERLARDDPQREGNTIELLQAAIRSS